MPRESYTKEQHEALAELLIDYIGGHWQTANVDGCIILWVKMNPKDYPLRFEIDRSGRVSG